MGIKFFFSWLKNEFPQYMTQFKKSDVPEVQIDTFMIDMNGLFHNSAAKIYKYGDFAQKSLLKRPQNLKKLQQDCFEDICKTIDELLHIVRPKKTLVLAIDGVAPLSKQNQQRQRRYRGIVENPHDLPKEDTFDPRAITPGTQWMDFLSKYIDFYIRKRINESEMWRNIEIVFSNEKVPGEGEHKLINYIRKFGTEKETYCINALDADLVMLSLGTNKPHFYLLREELYDKNFDFTYVDIGSGIREHIINELLLFPGNDKDQTIYDFILILFLCGNDFLPNIPSISLMDGLATIFDMYKNSCTAHGHLVSKNQDINFKSFGEFIYSLSKCESHLLETKFMHRQEYFPNPILENNMIILNFEDEHGTKTVQHSLQFEHYRKEFYEKKKIDSMEQAVFFYLDGCSWVLHYYLQGVTNWSYMFPYNYSPFLTDIVTILPNYKPKNNHHSQIAPISPFLQLLCVIPPMSSYLLPKPLDSIFKTYPHLFPKIFHINYDGKKKKWEGIVELPLVDVSFLEKECNRLSSLISESDKKRNICGKCFSYSFSEFISEYKSFYGHLKSHASSKIIDF